MLITRIVHTLNCTPKTAKPLVTRPGLPYIKVVFPNDYFYSKSTSLNQTALQGIKNRLQCSPINQRALVIFSFDGCETWPSKQVKVARLASRGWLLQHCSRGVSRKNSATSKLTIRFTHYRHSSQQNISVASGTEIEGSINPI